MVFLINEELSQFIWKEKEMNKLNNKITYIIIFILFVFSIFLFLRYQNKYKLIGEVSVCELTDGTVYQFINDYKGNTTKYFYPDGRSIECDAFSTTSVCEEFFNSFGSCEVVYRNFEENEESRLWSERAEPIIDLILKDKK